MTNELANEIEAYLIAKLEPEHRYILIISETAISHGGIISNYAGEKVIEILKEYADATYRAKPKTENN